MYKTLAARLVLPALAAFALSCDAQQSTSPRARNALASDGALSSKSGSRPIDHQCP
jgi:hypothetical protein